MRWLGPMPAAQLRESESFVAVSAGLEDLGLSWSDARTLSQTVLTELVENAAELADDVAVGPALNLSRRSLVSVAQATEDGAIVPGTGDARDRVHLVEEHHYQHALASVRAYALCITAGIVVALVVG